jgi:VIT family protein
MAKLTGVLEPVERISEVLFGIIIVLTFTCSMRLTRMDQGSVRTMLWGAIGCSVAWGLIDAVFYILGCLSERGHNLKLLKQVRATADPQEARDIIAGAMPPLIASNMHPEEFEWLRMRVKDLPEPPYRPPIIKQDLQGAAAVFLLAFGSILPVIIPFTFISDSRTALRVSNAIAIVLLFLAGHALGRYAAPHPWRVGVAMVVLGVAMVGLAIALGG